MRVFQGTWYLMVCGPWWDRQPRIMYLLTTLIHGYILVKFSSTQVCTTQQSDEQSSQNKNVIREHILSLLAQTRIGIVVSMTVITSQLRTVNHSPLLRMLPALQMWTATHYQHHTSYFPFKTCNTKLNFELCDMLDGTNLLNTIALTGTLAITVISQMFRNKYYFGRICKTFTRG
jgi:hypothetical protein